MEIIKETHKILIERRELQSDWRPIEDSFPSSTAAAARVDYLRSQAGTELYRIVQTSHIIYNY